MKRALLLVTFAGACSPPTPSRPMPGVSLTPHLDARPTTNACADTIDFDGDSRADLYLAYDYDLLGRLSHVDGAYTLGGTVAIDYAYDNVGHLTHSQQTSPGATTTIVSHFDTLGNLVDYTYDFAGTDFHDSYRYVYTMLDDRGLPTRDVISQLGQPDITYTLAYDARDRLALTVDDKGGTTIYTYDDDARTTTIDENNGAFHGVVVYDDLAHEISETWGGSDPSAIASATDYDWDGDRLLGATYQQATTDAPTVLVTIEADTLLYDCR